MKITFSKIQDILGINYKCVGKCKVFGIELLELSSLKDMLEPIPYTIPYIGIDPTKCKCSLGLGLDSTANKTINPVWSPPPPTAAATAAIAAPPVPPTKLIKFVTRYP